MINVSAPLSLIFDKRMITVDEKGIPGKFGVAYLMLVNLNSQIMKIKGIDKRIICLGDRFQICPQV